MTVETHRNVSSSSPVTDAPKETPVNTKAEPAKIPPSPAQDSAGKAVSPAQDLRDIQGLLVNGIFPGQLAPSVVKAYNLLEKLAVQIEAAQVVRAAP
jgi:hypothetical protein